MGKSDKLYSRSPKIERDGDGKVGIKKPAPADEEDMGLKGDAMGEGDPDEMALSAEQLDATHDRHQKEMKDMHKRHEDETKDMHKRHSKEVAKHYGKDKE